MRSQATLTTLAVDSNARTEAQSTNRFLNPATNNEAKKTQTKSIMNPKRIIMTALALMLSFAARADLIFVTNDVSGAVTWYATNTYLLRTVVYVRSNAVLSIEPGTVIKGATSNLITRTDIPLPVAALWVTRGGKLYATGTVERPIIFTYEGDNVNNPFDVPFAMSGQWGGVVILGNAIINSAQNLAGNNANPRYEVYEGVDGPGPNNEHIFGGNNDDDNSGVLRYVSIRYPGREFQTARELNGLTMGGVGRGTTIEYVEVFGSSDDAFEWWGGTVNTRYLVAAFNEDDDFDTDQGYRGTNQFWFGIKPPWAGTTDSRGFETDGDLYQTASQNEFPISQWAVYNATIIGRGTNETSTTLGRGWNARDETAANVIDSIITDFNTGLLLDTDGLLYFTNNPPQGNALHNIWGVVNPTVGTTGGFLFSDTARSNSVQNPQLGGVSYTNNLGLNPRPQPGSPALSDVLPQPAGLTQTSSRGAFNTNDLWAHKWTALYKLGYLQGTWSAQNVVTPECDSVSLSITRGVGNVTISWIGNAGCEYRLESTTTLNSPANWNSEGTFNGVGPHQHTAATPTPGNRFFRVIVL
jgi:hypothetical protein